MSTDPQAPNPKKPSLDSNTDAGPIIGIDLGTTNSLVAHCTEAGPVILESPEGERSLPSVVRLLASPNGSGYTVESVGEHVRDRAVDPSVRYLANVKRMMGRSYSEVIENPPVSPFIIDAGPRGIARIKLAVKDKPSVFITPQEVGALILRELKRWADAALKTDVTRAVITVPAYFDDAQRQATRDAGRLAGLNVMRIVNEPTAAALAYGLGVDDGKANKSPLADGGSISLNTKINPAACSSESEPDEARGSKPDQTSQTVAVYDLGGGTFDISILRLQKTESGTIDQVLATDGDTSLGGFDFDNLLYKLFRKEIHELLGKQSGVYFPNETEASLFNLAEQTKHQLSDQDKVEIDLPLSEVLPFKADFIKNAVYQNTITRNEFESLITPLIDRTLDACRRALRNAKLTAADIDRVILVGGSTRVPLVREKVAELFEAEPYTALNPDEVVALGASVQAAVLAGIQRGTLLLDVIPLSLGIETMGGAVAKLIVANSTIPARATEMFSTYAEGQTKVKIHVLQGERELVQDCRSLANFDLTGIPPMPAGLPKINVTFLVDANGILSVQAVEERSGRRARIQVVPNHGLTRDEVQQIEADSFAHARQDMNTHRLIDLRLNAKLDLRNIQKQLDRFPPKPTDTDSGPDPLALDPNYRAEIEQHMQTVQTYIDTPDADNNADAFQQALHDLDHTTLRLAELNIARTLRESD
ncbi:MAG: Hsp70 family protein [Planctomycetota bacterium]